MTIKTRNKM